MSAPAVTGAAALLLGLPMMLLALGVARRTGLLDRPTLRKRHIGEIALSGGLGVYATVLLVAGTGVLLGAAPPEPFVVAVLVLAVPMLGIGVLDDFRDLDARPRLLAQILIALVLTLAFDVRLIWLDDVLGTGAVGFETVGSIVFTVFCVVGALNATNMMDGINGLLAALAVVSFAAIAALAGDPATVTLCAAFVGALLAFLAFNLGLFGNSRRIFLGDSGSMMIGLALATVLVARSQSVDAAIAPVAAGWLLGLPLLDAAIVMVRRLRERRSPLAAGRDHLHHRLQNLGLSPGQTLAAMIALQGGMVGVGLTAQFSSLPPWVFFHGFVALAIACYFLDFGLVERPASPADGSAFAERPGAARHPHDEDVAAGTDGVGHRSDEPRPARAAGAAADAERPRPARLPAKTTAEAD